MGSGRAKAAHNDAHRVQDPVPGHELFQSTLVSLAHDTTRQVMWAMLKAASLLIGRNI